MKKTDLKEVPRSRHRTKPKFDIPVETAAAEPSVGWVYRAEVEEVDFPAPQAESAAVAVENYPTMNPGPAKKASPRDPFVMVGEGLFLVGLGTMTLVLRVASEMITAPIRLVGRMRPSP